MNGTIDTSIFKTVYEAFFEFADEYEEKIKSITKDEKILKKAKENMNLLRKHAKKLKDEIVNNPFYAYNASITLYKILLEFNGVAFVSQKTCAKIISLSRRVVENEAFAAEIQELKSIFELFLENLEVEHAYIPGYGRLIGLEKYNELRKIATSKLEELKYFEKGKVIYSKEFDYSLCIFGFYTDTRVEDDDFDYFADSFAPHMYRQFAKYYGAKESTDAIFFAGMYNRKKRKCIFKYNLENNSLCLLYRRYDEKEYKEVKVRTYAGTIFRLPYDLFNDEMIRTMLYLHINVFGKVKKERRRIIRYEEVRRKYTENTY